MMCARVYVCAAVDGISQNVELNKIEMNEAKTQPIFPLAWQISTLNR